MKQSVTQEELHLEFEALASPLMEWLDSNFHPHTTIIINALNAEILEGIMVTNNVEFKD